MVSFHSIFNLLPNAQGSLFSLCIYFSYIISGGISLSTQPWLEFSPEKNRFKYSMPYHLSLLLQTFLLTYLPRPSGDNEV